MVVPSVVTRKLCLPPNGLAAALLWVPASLLPSDRSFRSEQSFEAFWVGSASESSSIASRSASSGFDATEAATPSPGFASCLLAGLCCVPALCLKNAAIDALLDSLRRCAEDLFSVGVSLETFFRPPCSRSAFASFPSIVDARTLDLVGKALWVPAVEPRSFVDLFDSQLLGSVLFSGLNSGRASSSSSELESISLLCRFFGRVSMLRQRGTMA